MEKRDGDPDSSHGSASKALALDCSPELLDKLDAWIAERPEPHPGRSEAILHILGDALAGVGSASIPVDELNASNDE
jgi:hypothetical protein